MNYADLTNRVAELDVFETKAQAKQTLEAIKAIITEELTAGNSVALGQNFGTFSTAVREGKAPTSGKPYKTNVAKFKASAPLKRALNNN